SPDPAPRTPRAGPRWSGSRRLRVRARRPSVAPAHQGLDEEAHAREGEEADEGGLQVDRHTGADADGAETEQEQDHAPDDRPHARAGAARLGVLVLVHDVSSM